MNKELMEALDLLEKEKGISKSAILEAIEASLVMACKNHFGTNENIRVSIDPETCDFKVFSDREVVEKVDFPNMEISLENARSKKPGAVIGDIIPVLVDSKDFGRIATQNAKGIIVQKIREEERRVLYNEYYEMERSLVTGTVERFQGGAIIVKLEKLDAFLSEKEQVSTEHFEINDKIKVYVVEVKDGKRGPRVVVSRTHPEFVRRLFEEEVSEVREGIVEIKSIAREAGSRTKLAVFSNNSDVDPVGACVGLNGSRVNTIVEELHGEKIDVISWDENPAYLIENALSPAKVIAVIADQENREAMVIVPDMQLSLAIGKEGQNARLAAKLTNYKIDIKSESQAAELGIFEDMGIEYKKGNVESHIDDAGVIEDVPEHLGLEDNAVIESEIEQVDTEILEEAEDAIIADENELSEEM